MASNRNLIITLDVFAASPKRAHKEARRIVKRLGMRKVHAYSIVPITRTVEKFRVDIVIKESVYQRVPISVVAWSETLGEKVY